MENNENKALESANAEHDAQLLESRVPGQVVLCRFHMSFGGRVEVEVWGAPPYGQKTRRTRCPTHEPHSKRTPVLKLNAGSISVVFNMHAKFGNPQRREGEKEGK